MKKFSKTGGPEILQFHILTSKNVGIKSFSWGFSRVYKKEEMTFAEEIFWHISGSSESVRIGSDAISTKVTFPSSNLVIQGPEFWPVD